MSDSKSPFVPVGGKASGKAPIKRSDSINAFKKKQEEAKVEPEEKVVMAPTKPEDEGPSIARFIPPVIIDDNSLEFGVDPEAIKSKSIASRQKATELKFTPFDESQTQPFEPTHKPTLQERIDANMKSGLVFTDIADKDALGAAEYTGKPSLQERIKGQNTEFAFTPMPVSEEEAKKEEPSPFKPVKEKGTFTKPTYKRPAANQRPGAQSPFAPKIDEE
ncbi:MAG: hypothetical protein MJ094_00655 [Saccharofermentans sp.]|nr:hypothetical protein [Saccharofermentans sp.]